MDDISEIRYIRIRYIRVLLYLRREKYNSFSEYSVILKDKSLSKVFKKVNFLVLRLNVIFCNRIRVHRKTQL